MYIAYNKKLNKINHYLILSVVEYYLLIGKIKLIYYNITYHALYFIWINAKNRCNPFGIVQLLSNVWNIARCNLFDWSGYRSELNSYRS